MRDKPPDAYPTTVLTKLKPAAVAEHTSKRRVPAGIVLDKVAEPVLTVPIDKIPVRVGDKFITAS